MDHISKESIFKIRFFFKIKQQKTPNREALDQNTTFGCSFISDQGEFCSKVNFMSLRACQIVTVKCKKTKKKTISSSNLIASLNLFKDTGKFVFQIRLTRVKKIFFIFFLLYIWLLLTLIHIRKDTFVTYNYSSTH